MPRIRGGTTGPESCYRNKTNLHHKGWRVNKSTSSQQTLRLAQWDDKRPTQQQHLNSCRQKLIGGSVCVHPNAHRPHNMSSRDARFIVAPKQAPMMVWGMLRLPPVTLQCYSPVLSLPQEQRRPARSLRLGHSAQTWLSASLSDTIRFYPSHRTPHLPDLPSFRTASRERSVAAGAGTIRRRFGRPPFGGRPHLESPSSSFLASAEAVAVQAMDCISCT